MGTIEEMQEAVNLIPVRTMLMPIERAGHELTSVRTVVDVTTTVVKAFWNFVAIEK